MALERSEIVLYQADENGWEYPSEVAHALDLGEGRLSIMKPPEKP